MENLSQIAKRIVLRNAELRGQGMRLAGFPIGGCNGMPCAMRCAGAKKRDPTKPKRAPTKWQKMLSEFWAERKNEFANIGAAAAYLKQTGAYEKMKMKPLRKLQCKKPGANVRCKKYEKDAQGKKKCVKKKCYYPKPVGAGKKKL